MLDSLLEAGLTAATVATLLLGLRAAGQRLVGLFAGLPIVTAPALGWLALTHGPGFAAEAALGCIGAGLSCALFGLGYAVASRRARPLAALLAGSSLAALPLPLLGFWRPEVATLVALSLAACAACSSALRGSQGRRAGCPELEAAARPAGMVVGLTACMAGAMSGAVTLLAGDLGAFWCGALASAPLIAAAVAMRLHLDRGSAAVAPFMRGYVGGVIGRTCFAALFGLLVAPVGALPALACASLLLCLGLWLSAGAPR